MATHISNMFLKRPRGVLLDWDGTLADTFPIARKAYDYTCEVMDVPLIGEDEQRRMMGPNRQQVMEEGFGERWEEALGHYSDFYEKNYLDLIEPMPGAQELIFRMSAWGMVVGIVSNKRPRFLNAEIDHFGWRTMIKATVGSGEAKEDKPSPKPLELCMERAGLKAHDKDVTAYVGDTQTDMLAGNRAGLKCVYVKNGYGEDEDLKFRKKVLMVKDLIQLKDFMNVA